MKELTGQKFNRLTVLAFSHREHGTKYWLCRCDCGTQRPIREYKLGKIQSCGCYRSEAAHNRQRHSASATKEYHSYKWMLREALGGFTEVCQRWRDSFENFLADVGPAPSPGHLFARLDKRQGFEPNNCKWATREEARQYRATIERGVAAKLGKLTLDTVIKNAPAFFLALPKQDRREVLRLTFRLPAESVGGHDRLRHWPSWKCKRCRDELVAAIAWERLSRMKCDLTQLTISQALLDLSIERVLAERNEKTEITEAALKRRAYEDYLFLSTGRASGEQFEQLWDSELRERYVRLHAAKQALREQDISEQAKD